MESFWPFSDEADIKENQALVISKTLQRMILNANVQIIYFNKNWFPFHKMPLVHCRKSNTWILLVWRLYPQASEILTSQIKWNPTIFFSSVNFLIFNSWFRLLTPYFGKWSISFYCFDFFYDTNALWDYVSMMPDNITSIIM